MTGNYTILHGDSLQELKKLDDNSIDSCVTDPPYGLSKEPKIEEVLTKWLAGEEYDHGHGGFMGKSWDSFVPHPDLWREVYRVLKPGGHAVIFSGTRTQDLMTISLRLAGFEVRDVIEWLYFSGFPKSHDVGKAFDKRAGVRGERVPAEGVGFMNAEGKGGYNVTTHRVLMPEATSELAKQWDGWGTALKPAHEPIIVVRKPLEGTVAGNVEEYGTGTINIDGSRISFSGDKPKETSNQNIRNGSYKSDNGDRDRDTVYTPAENGRFPANIVTVDDDAFYSKYSDVTPNITPQELSKKSSKSDRNSDWKGDKIEGNVHPTVKPLDLMAWLVRLVTPPEGTVLDPFAGSGSTLVAAKREGFGFIGVELTDEYIPIIEARTGEKVQKSDSVSEKGEESKEEALV